MPAIDPKWLEDVNKLKELDSTELRKLGRIPYPLSRKPGEKKFTRISWDEALNRIAAKINSIKPKQLAFYLTARGITNEVYYTAAKVARFLGRDRCLARPEVCRRLLEYQKKRVSNSKKSLGSLSIFFR
jgi:anaerobic selenocysteine-containing dehydrogenase